MKEYLELSSRTSAAPRINREGLFNSDSDILLSIINSVARTGLISDCSKRSLFYSDPNIQVRMDKKEAELDVIEGALESELNSSTIKLTSQQIDLTHAILGLSSETAEIAEEMVNAQLAHREIDKVNLEEEVGDLLWYIALLLRTIGSDFETAAAKNIAKLAKRYPEKFTTDNALVRDLDAEKDALTSKKAD